MGRNNTGNGGERGNGSCGGNERDYSGATLVTSSGRRGGWGRGGGRKGRGAKGGKRWRGGNGLGGDGMVASASGNAQGQRPMAGGADGWVSSGRGGECGPGLPRMQRPTRRAQPGWGLETGAAPTNEEAEQNVRWWHSERRICGLGMRSGGGGCELRGARGGGGRLSPPVDARGSRPPSLSP